jgi:josephin
MDSKLDRPERIGDREKIISYLENAIKSKDKELILIVNKEVEQNGTWKF